MCGLLGREPPCEAVLYHRYLLEEAVLGLVDAPPGLREDGIGLLLCKAGIAEHARLPAASAVLPAAASVAASGPCAEPGGMHPRAPHRAHAPLPAPSAARRSGASRPRRARSRATFPAAPRSSCSCRRGRGLPRPASLRLRQPHICPGMGLPPFLPGSFGHALSASSCTSSGRPLRPPPHRFRHPSDMYS